MAAIGLVRGGRRLSFRSHDRHRMTASTLPLAADARAALDAFLREIERRAAVFAELACGSAPRGDAAVEAAVQAFCRAAARGPLPDWTLQFWSLLLASPQLQAYRGPGHWPDALARLADLGPGLRAALLLRLVAGLDDTQAAQVLGIAVGTYASALQRAGGARQTPAGAARWQALAMATRQQLRLLPGERLLRLAQARERSLAGRPPPRRRRGGTQQRLVWAVLAACAVALVATFLLPKRDGANAPEVRVSALPPAEAPLDTFDADTALLTHPDFDQLAAPPPQAALARDLGFYAWYAAEAGADSTAPMSITSAPAANTSVATATTANGAAPAQATHAAR